MDSTTGAKDSLVTGTGTIPPAFKAKKVSNHSGRLPKRMRTGSAVFTPYADRTIPQLAVADVPSRRKDRRMRCPRRTGWPSQHLCHIPHHHVDGSSMGTWDEPISARSSASERLCSCGQVLGCSEGVMCGLTFLLRGKIFRGPPRVNDVAHCGTRHPAPRSCRDG